MPKKIQVTGYLEQDPDFMTDQKGKELAVLSLSSLEGGKTDDGKQQIGWKTIRVSREPIISWLKQNVKKGDLLRIRGSLSYIEESSPTFKMNKIPHIVVNKRGGTIMKIITNKITMEKKNESID